MFSQQSYFLTPWSHSLCCFHAPPYLADLLFLGVWILSETVQLIVVIFMNPLLAVYELHNVTDGLTDGPKDG